MFEQHRPKEKTVFHESAWRLVESVGADTLTINNKHCFCIVDYHSQFPVIKQVEGINVDNLIKIQDFQFQNTGCSIK